MSRTLKRVPLDFNWPTGKVWGGYLNPYASQTTPCQECDGSGLSKEAKRFRDQWYGYVDFDPIAYGATPVQRDNPAIVELAQRNVAAGGIARNLQQEIQRLFLHFSRQWAHHLIQDDVDALIAAGRLKDFTHTPRTDEQRATVREKVAAGGNSWLPESNGYRPSAEEVNDWSLRGLGHDSINEWICVEARCKRADVERECHFCDGEGTLWPTPKIKQQSEDWTPEEPPTGEGFQLWQTTSEGSPVSPVFDSLDALCEWCSSNATTFGSFTASAEEWRQMLEADFVHAAEGNMIFL